MARGHLAGWCAGALLLAVAAQFAQAATVAIVIDDMGNNLALGNRALALPGEISYAFLPHTPHAAKLSQIAYDNGRESLLHLPMQSRSDHRLGPGGLNLGLDAESLKRTLEEDLASVPHAVGINNHMGSLLTTDSDSMTELMSALRQRGGLYFLDSRTHDQTLAEEIAKREGVPSSRRNLFLDNERDPERIREQFNLLVKLAQQKGSAIAIAHPYPETLAVLQELIPELAREGISLLPLSQVIQSQQVEAAKLAAQQHRTGL